jgi:putative transcriptional regulator
MNNITHHLEGVTLMSFAAGALPAALSAVAAAHITMCERCRREVAAFERLGGVLIATLPPASLERSGLEVPDVSVPPRQRREASQAQGQVTLLLASLLDGELDAVRWRRLGLGVWHHRLPVKGSGALGVIKVAPGRSVPEHGHGGAELTLVLHGSFRDATGQYQTGDVADLDETIEHRPVADPGPDCVCLVASEAPARFHGLFARLIQPLHGL